VLVAGLRILRAALKVIDVSEDGLSVDSQIFVDAKEKNLRVVEVPCFGEISEGCEDFEEESFSTRSEVIVSLIELVSERKPLLFLGVPGLMLLTMGGAAFIMVRNIVNIIYC